MWRRTPWCDWTMPGGVLARCDDGHTTIMTGNSGMTKRKRPPIEAASIPVRQNDPAEAGPSLRENNLPAPAGADRIQTEWRLDGKSPSPLWILTITEASVSALTRKVVPPATAPNRSSLSASSFALLRFEVWLFMVPLRVVALCAVDVSGFMPGSGWCAVTRITRPSEARPPNPPGVGFEVRSGRI